MWALVSWFHGVGFHVWVFKVWLDRPSRGLPLSRTPFRRTAQNFALFPLSSRKMCSSVPSNVHVWALWLLCEAPAALGPTTHSVVRRCTPPKFHLKTLRDKKIKLGLGHRVDEEDVDRGGGGGGGGGVWEGGGGRVGLSPSLPSDLGPPRDRGHTSRARCRPGGGGRGLIPLNHKFLHSCIHCIRSETRGANLALPHHSNWCCARGHF